MVTTQVSLPMAYFWPQRQQAQGPGLWALSSPLCRSWLSGGSLKCRDGLVARSLTKNYPVSYVARCLLGKQMVGLPKPGARWSYGENMGFVSRPWFRSQLCHILAGFIS